jgi:hypothetical protein
MTTKFTEIQQKALKSITLSTSSTWASLGGAFRGIAAPNYYAGNLFAFTRNTDNSLGMCTVSPSESGSWTKLGGQLLSNPASAASPNGTLGVIGLMQGNVVEVNYVDPFGGVQTGFSNFAGGTPSGVTWTGSPVLAVNSNNRIEAFMFDNKGTMWHCYQTNVGSAITWSNWSVLGSTFLTSASFQVYLNNNTGALQAVAIGTDNQIYQMVQYAGGGHDGWSSPTQVGTLPSVTPQFTLGAAAAYNTSTALSVFSGFNSQSGVSANPLMYSSGPNSKGTWTNLTLSDNPISTSAPIMLSNQGVPQLIYQSSTNVGQVLLLSQNTAATSFWKPQQDVGSQNGDLSGQLSGVVNNGNVALFQCGKSSGQLYYINYTPS